MRYMLLIYSKETQMGESTLHSAHLRSGFVAQ